MALEPHSKLGTYEVLALLGAGGMGEVYRARDTQLDRAVALKVLPVSLAERASSMARFEREAKLLAALDHPCIAAIHGLHEDGGTRFLVMELVEGETLAARLRHGALPAREALEIGCQIAEALEAAHGDGVIHRDLKPSNVMLTPKGRVKLLDFGLAKALQDGPLKSSIATETTPPDATGEGTVLGTAPYMSPEQARGETLDERTDLWALGCVLYESLAGDKAFPGSTRSDAIASVLAREPDWTALPTGTPAMARSLIRRCLTKEPGQRLHDARTALVLLDESLNELSGSLTSTASMRAAAAPRSMGSAKALAAGLVIGAVGAGLGAWWASRPAPDGPHTPLRLSAGISGETDVFLDGLSPDGSRVLYTARSPAGEFQRYLRRLDQVQAEPLQLGARQVEGFSPDGEWLLAKDGPKLMKVSLEGGVSIALCDVQQFRGASWGEDGTIVFAPDVKKGLWRVSADGGEPSELTRPDRERGQNGHRKPKMLPGGRAALFTILNESFRLEDTHIGVVSLETGEWKVVVERGAGARYLEGHLVYGRSGALLAVPFDLDTLEVTGSAVPLIEDVKMFPSAGYILFDVTPSGVLAYQTGFQQRPERALVFVDRKGDEEAVTERRRAYQTPRVSPDGQSLVFTVEEAEEDQHLWLHDLRRGTQTRVTSQRNVAQAAWSPDGSALAVSWNRDGPFELFSVAPDGGRAPERLAALPGFPTSWSAKGPIALEYHTPGKGADVWILPAPGEPPQSFVATAAFDRGAAFSPDGRWVAYQSQESGLEEVYVTPFPGPGLKLLVSTRGGQAPVWAHDGRELFYRSLDGAMMSVAIRTEPTLEAGAPVMLFAGDYVSGNPAQYDVLPGDERFIMVKPPDEKPEPSQIIVIPNFAEELRARMAAAAPRSAG